ncbi:MULTISPECIES: AIPR family protein [Serratia]|nr:MULTISPECIES: AIPR family protein [Serratia]MBH2726243.1 AIPR family protein [Serratia marcescens]MBH2817324.1 AIPR family protein [Serratia marcescens]PIJ10519.1 abortive phage resistance protein [Serratia sp. OMLW3]PIJ13132.1 abortive phage resistance protein [Serratia sp. OLAL2]HEI9784957.1 AIPR family protein [Serratia marcescens]
MASINDFKLLNLKCLKYYDLLEKTVSFKTKPSSEMQKKRFGFYMFMLEALCGVRDLEELAKLITDTDFNKHLTGENNDDLGIDAVYIDEDNNAINIFNFKFRESFKPGGKQSLNETILSTKYVGVIFNEDTNGLEGKPKKFAREVIEKLNGNDIWKFNLYVISNEDVEVDLNDNSLRQLKNTYDLEVLPVGLSYISNILSIRPAAINATVIIDPDALMSYSEHSLSSSISYIARLKCSEIVRITCNDHSLREKYNIEDLEPLCNASLDFGALFDNVRGFVVNSKYNGNIGKSLKEEPTRFFMYNNGITMVARSIKTSQINANKKLKVDIQDFQILNGGQTVRSIHNFNVMDKSNIIEHLSKSEILVRMFVADGSSDTVNKIAEYTNSQNTISPSDLKSLSSEQIAIEQYLNEHDIVYARKTGDTGVTENKNYKHKISMIKFGQLLLALAGYPEKSSNQKKQIFGSYYDMLFGKDNFDIQESPRIVERYYEVVSSYDKIESIKSIEQKHFYIMYLDTKKESVSIRAKIDFLEKMIRTYATASDTSDARKMIQVGFKNHVDDHISMLFD